MLTALLALHLLAAVFWVGGMAFAYWVLRPAAGPLEPRLRLPLWRRVFGKFLPWVGRQHRGAARHRLCDDAIYFGGFAAAPLYINVMQGLGILMVLLFLHLVVRAVETLPRRARSRRAARGRQGSSIRSACIVAVNLALGIITVMVGGTGRYW